MYTLSPYGMVNIDEVSLRWTVSQVDWEHLEPIRKQGKKEEEGQRVTGTCTLTPTMNRRRFNEFPIRTFPDLPQLDMLWIPAP